jgi:hypothetical protein
MTNDQAIVTATKSTAWVKRNADGTYEIAPSHVADHKRAGYVMTSMITPADGAQRTVFPEMHQ